MLNFGGRSGDPVRDDSARMKPWDKASIEHLLLCVAGNAHPVIDPSSQSVIGCMISPLAALLNHSSIPNGVLHTPAAMDRLLLRTVRPIRKGESLSYAYIDTYMDPMERLTMLAESFGFVDTTALPHVDKSSHLPPTKEALTMIYREEMQYGSLPSLASALACPHGCPGPAIPWADAAARDGASVPSPAVQAVSALSRSHALRSLVDPVPHAETAETPRVARTCLSCQARISSSSSSSSKAKPPTAARIVRSLSRAWQEAACRSDARARLEGLLAVGRRPSFALLHPMHQLRQDMDTSLFVAAREVGEWPVALRAVGRAVLRLHTVTPASLDRVALLERQHATIAAQAILPTLRARAGVTLSQEQLRYTVRIAERALEAAEAAFGPAHVREDRPRDEGRDHPVPEELFALYSRVKVLERR